MSVPEAIAKLQFLPNRLPSTTDEDAKDAFSELAAYRDGGVFVAHWARDAASGSVTLVGDEIAHWWSRAASTIYFRVTDGLASVSSASWREHRATSWLVSTNEHLAPVRDARQGRGS